MVHAPLWTYSGEPAPGPDAKGSDIVDALWTMFDAYAFRSMSETRQWALLRKTCEDNKWSWVKVKPVLRREAIFSRVRAGGSDIMQYTESGIPIYPERFAGPQPTCPFTIRYYHLGYCAVMPFDKSCYSFLSRCCGAASAERLLLQVGLCIRDLELVHIAEATWEEGLFNRMTQRRYSRTMNTFTYCALDGSVTFISDKPSGGTGTPVTSKAVSPTEALEWLVPKLWVPGWRMAKFSKGWIRRPPPAGPEEGHHVSLSGLDDEQIGEFSKSAAEHLVATYGVEKNLPRKYWPAARAALTQIRSRIIEKSESLS